MARTTTFPTSTRPTPLYAAVGAGDLMVEKIRRTNLDPESFQGRIETRVAEFRALPGQVRALPERAQSAASEAIDQASSVYVDLAKRGEELVARIRGQESTQTAKRQARNTTSQAKGTTTTGRRTVKAQDVPTDEVKQAASSSTAGVKRAAKTTRSRAKATTTSTRKTAESSAKAATEAAEKVGD